MKHPIDVQGIYNKYLLEINREKRKELDKIKPKDIKYMIANLSAVRDEVVEAIEGHDKQLNEVYSHLNKPMKKQIIKIIFY